MKRKEAIRYKRDAHKIFGLECRKIYRQLSKSLEESYMNNADSFNVSDMIVEAHRKVSKRYRKMMKFYKISQIPLEELITSTNA